VAAVALPAARGNKNIALNTAKSIDGTNGLVANPPIRPSLGSNAIRNVNAGMLDNEPLLE